MSIRDDELPQELATDWGTPDNDTPPEAPADLAAATKLAAELKEEIAGIALTLKQKEDKLQDVRQELLAALEFMGIESIRAHGYLFHKEEKTSVTTPKTTEQKQELFEYLKEKGLYWEMVSVNSQTLNALYHSLSTQAEEEGILAFKLPGVPDPTTYTNLKMRRS